MRPMYTRFCTLSLLLYKERNTKIRVQNAPPGYKTGFCVRKKRGGLRYFDKANRDKHPPWGAMPAGHKLITPGSQTDHKLITPGALFPFLLCTFCAISTPLRYTTQRTMLRAKESTNAGGSTDNTSGEQTTGTTGTPARRYSLADIQTTKRRNKYSYETHAGRRRINTMLHPELKKALQRLADAHGQTVPDVLEGILCDYLDIQLPGAK